jgi:hypothetical protein
MVEPANQIRKIFRGTSSNGRQEIWRIFVKPIFLKHYGAPEKIDSLAFPAVFSGSELRLVYISDGSLSIKESQPGSIPSNGLFSGGSVIFLQFFAMI